jgi:hypothetical protein
MSVVKLFLGFYAVSAVERKLENWKTGKNLFGEFLPNKFSTFPVFQFSDIRETSDTHHRTSGMPNLWPVAT